MKLAAQLPAQSGGDHRETKTTLVGDFDAWPTRLIPGELDRIRCSRPGDMELSGLLGQGAIFRSVCRKFVNDQCDGLRLRGLKRDGRTLNGNELTARQIGFQLIADQALEIGTLPA